MGAEPGCLERDLGGQWGLDFVRRAISASFGRRPRFGLPTQVQRDVAETLSVVGTKLLSFYREGLPSDWGSGSHGQL